MFDSEKELIEAGFILTPNAFHDGIGNTGKVYAKSFEDEDKEGRHYEYFSVDSNGVVAPYVLAKNVIATPEVVDVVAPVVQDVVAPEVPVAPVATVVEDAPEEVEVPVPDPASATPSDVTPE